MRNAFTLSEILVTITLIGVIASILIPVLNNARPNKDIITFKKAMYTIQNGVTEATQLKTYGSSGYWKDASLQPDTFCTEVINMINKTGSVSCDCGGEASSYENPNFISTDGIRFWGLECRKFDSSPVRVIYADRKISEKEKASVFKTRGREELGLKIKVRYDGKVFVDKEDEYENTLVDNSFQIN